jgi:hypothetical protein
MIWLKKESAIRVAAAVIALALAVLCAPLMAAVPGSPVKMKTNVLFIIDSSGSMWERIDGEPKVIGGRKILSDVLKDLPPDANLGLLTFGHRRKSDCSDIELVAPIGSKNADEIVKIANSLKPKGTTPLSASLLQAAEAFKGIDGAKMVVLITDGGEECQGDPCAVARQMALSGLVVRVNVVGFTLSDKEREQLQCVAKEGTGRFFDVKDKGSLYAAVGELKKDIETYAPEPPPVAAPAPVSPPPPALADIVSPPAPPAPAAPNPNDVNLLLPTEGGEMLVAENARWKSIVTGNDTDSMWTWVGQDVVFGFKNGKAARFSRFQIAIPSTAPQNVQEFELLASKDSLKGPYVRLGRFSTQNGMGESLFQEFTFAETTAKYFKFKPLSNYGYEMQGWGNTQIFQIRLMGTLQ